MAQESTVSFKLNIPVSLKDRLSEAAERSGRSLTSEIVTRLEASISMSDEGGLDFTLESFEQFILEAIENETSDLRQKVRELEYIATGRDPYNVNK